MEIPAPSGKSSLALDHTCPNGISDGRTSIKLHGNRAPPRFNVPHDTHCASIGVPHPSQNFAVAPFSAPHFEQRIILSLLAVTLDCLYVSQVRSGWIPRGMLDFKKAIVAVFHSLPQGFVSVG